MAVKALAQQILQDLKDVNEKGSEGPMTRETLKEQQGQILVISGPKFRNILKSILKNPDVTKKQLDKIWKGWTKYLSGQGSRLPTERKAELQEVIDSLKLPKGSRAYMITAYATIRIAKSGKGVLGTLIKTNYAKNRESKKLRGKLDLIGGADNIEGAQLGHEEAGTGVATTGVAAMSAEARLRQLGYDGRSKIIKHIHKYYDDMEISIEHHQVVDANGGIKKEYIPILTWQASKANQGKQKDMEKAFFEELKERLSSEIATMEGSTPLIDAVEMVLFDAAAPKKRKGVRTVGTRKKRVSDRNTGRAKTRAKVKKAQPIIHDDGVDAKSVMAIPTQKKTRSVSPFSYAAMINKELPETIRKNMGAPALENRTGRFASSVKIQDVQRTKKGLLSFGYSYAKDPYQVFEVGSSGSWSSTQRDPRKLIDRSIREVAADLALGRFYTRRL